MSNTGTTLGEFYKNSDYRKFQQEHRRGGTALADFIDVHQHAHDFIDAPFDQLSICIVLDADMPFRCDFGDGWTEEQQVRTQDIFMVPPNTEVRYDCGGEHHILTTGFSINRISTLLDEFGSKLDVLNPLYRSEFTRDEIIRSTVVQMWNESRGGDPTRELMVDGLFQIMMARLLRLAQADIEVASERFSRPLMSKLDEHIDAHISQKLTVSELAELANCSQFYFMRSFKKTLGVSPYQYVISRRVELAKDMLKNPNTSIIDIAYHCGFSSQSHMTDVFSKRVGVTPSAYRQHRGVK